MGGEVVWNNQRKKFKKEGLLFDLHFHTKYSDGSSSIKQIEKKCNKYNFGVAITDHNTIKGCLKAQKYNFNFIPAVELRSKEEVDVLVYFYSINEAKDFDEKIIKRYFKKKGSIGSLKLGILEILDIAKDFNCVTSLPHPFAYFQYFGLKKKKEGYVESKNKGGFESIKKVDTVEIMNGHLFKRSNLKAAELAKDFNKPFTGGSDGHINLDLGKVLTYSKGDTKEEFLDNLLKSKENNKIYVFNGRVHSMVLARTFAFRKHIIHPIYYSKRIAKVGKNLIKNG